MKLMEMTWRELEGKTKAVIPVGSIEQHGPHLPLSTDAFIARAVSLEIARKIGGVLAPPMVTGVSQEHMDFPGTISLTPEVFLGKIRDVCNSLLKHGFKEIILINGHGGNRKALESLKMKNVRYVDIIGKIKNYDHAGEIETSLMLHIHPELVRKKLIKKHEFTFPGKKQWKTIDYSKSGVLGDPTKASPEKGKAYFKRIVSAIMTELEK